MCRFVAALISGLTGLSLFLNPAVAYEPTLGDTTDAIRTWRSADGLPSDSVTAVIQTRDAYLWIGTSGGLVRFDGVKFSRVNLTTNSSIASLHITALCEDKSGALWVGTQQDGLFQLKAGSVQHHSKTGGLLDDSITSLATDQQGFVWIGTKAGLNLAAGHDFRALTTLQGLPDNLIAGVHVARSGTVWITTRNGMSRFVNGRIAPFALQTDSQGRSPEYLGAYEDRNGNIWAFGDTYLINLAEGKRFNYFRSAEATSVRIWSLCEGRDGRLWIGTSGRGLFCFDNNRFQPVVLGELRGPYDVRAICEDREGNLWLGTSGGGLVQLRPQPVHLTQVGQGLPASPPTALALDASGRTIVGLQRGGLFVSEAGQFDRFTPGGAWGLPDSVTALALAPDGAVWVGTLGGLYGLREGRVLQFTTANGLGDDAVLSVCVDAAGGVWAGTRAGTLHRFATSVPSRFDASHGLNDSPITALLATSDAIWAGTENGSIFRGEKGQAAFTEITGKTLHYPVVALYHDEDHRLWIGSAGGGLVCLVNGKRHAWSIETGLPDNVVAGIIEDDRRNLWLVTGTGIYRVNRSAVSHALATGAPLQCKLIAESKTALEPKSVGGGARALVTPEGNLCFATTEGVLNVDTRRPQVEPTTLPVYFESAILNGRPIPLMGGDNAAADSNPESVAIFTGEVRSLEIHYTALDFAAPEVVRFRHKLEGFDTDWVSENSERFTRYGRLPYGAYRFRLAARHADGTWQETAAPLAFIVPTPLYLQGWAVLLYIVGFVALVVAVVRVVSHRRLRVALARMEQQQSLERERMRIARDMHDEIGSKLTKISFLSEHVKMDVAQTGPLAGRIQSIAETSRDLLKTMDEIVWVVNPRNDNVEHLTAYLSHHAVEYFQNTSIECEMKLPRALPERHLSSEARHNLFLAFEEALNNVLKHSGASHVKIEMEINGPVFEIVVSDNGRGFESRAASNLAMATGQGGRGGNGLRNLRQRLADIGGECVIRSQPGAGCTVTLRFRLDQKALR
jgi:ligand-binding sensor domain-containing protein/signal transduction histidine kinase